MLEKRQIPVILGLICALGLGAAAAQAAGSIEGRWLLIEQHYGKGASDLAPEASPVHLEFVQEGGRIAGRIWAGDSRAQAVNWPAFAADDRYVRTQIDEYETSPGRNRIRAAYTVDPSVEGKLTLKIVEEYRLTDGGKSLKGTLTVKFLHAGEPRGSYVLHRRFERQP